MSMRQWLLVGLINVGAAVVAVLTFGLWKHHDLVDKDNDQTKMEGSIVADGFYVQGIEDVGFITQENRRVTARKLLGSRILYDVTYTTGPDHFRVVPTTNQAQRCVLLFGDSLTFGEGVNDHETTAAQVVAKSKGTIAAKSLGIGGWGPHQFLAGVQSQRFQRAITCQPTDAVFLFIQAHLGRAAGRGRWDKYGPLYYLNAYGKPIRLGNFNSAPRSLRELIGLNRLTDEEEVALSVALIAAATHELQSQYPRLRFHLFTWDGTSEEVIKQLAQRGLQVSTIHDLIPDFSDAYLIAPPVESHPSPAAYGRIADHILSLMR